MNDTRNAITNSEGKVGALSWPNPDDFARVICSTDCPDIYVEGNERGYDVELRSVGEAGSLQMNLRSIGEVS